MSRSWSATGADDFPDQNPLRQMLPWAALFVLGGLLLVQVFLYGSNLPYSDEWYDTVPALTHQHPVNLQWLWSPFNGHRILLPRLALLGALTLGHGNFRAGDFLNALTLIVAVALLLRGLSRRDAGTAGAAIPGGLIWTDALLPILFLNWGTQGDVLWPFEIQFALTVLLVFLLLATIFRRPSPPSRGSVLLLLGAFLLLPLCGLNGLLFVPLPALWLAATPFFKPAVVGEPGASATAAPVSPPPTNRFALWLLLLLPAAVLLIYFVGLPHDKHPIPAPARFVGTALTFLQLGWGICSVDSGARPFSAPWISGVIPLLALIGFLTIVARSFGRGGAPDTPLTGDRETRALPLPMILAAASAVVLTLALVLLPRLAIKLSAVTMLLFAPFLLLAAGVALLRGWRDLPQERCRTGGITALYLSSLLLTLGVAFGRGGAREELSSPHYTILAALVPCIAYIIFRLRNTPANRRLRALLFFWVLLLLPVNMNRSRQGLVVKKADIRQFNADVAAGLPVPVLIGKYQGSVLGRLFSPEEYERDLRAMQASHLDHFERVNDAPSLDTLFRSGIPLTGEDGSATTLPASLSGRTGSIAAWRFAPMPGAMVYIRFTEPAVPESPAPASDTDSLAEYNVVWHRSIGSRVGGNGSDGASKESQGETLYILNTHTVEKTHDSVFYAPDGVDGVSIVCTAKGTPLTVTKLCVVPLPAVGTASGTAR